MALQPNEQINFDSLQDSGFLSAYRSLPEKSPTTIRIFDRTEYYTVHGEDALFTAKEVYNTSAIIKYLGTEPNVLPSLVLNKANFESWVRDLLLVKQYRVEIYQNKATGKNKNDWVLAQKASPGNLAEFEELLFVSGENPNLVGVMAVMLASDGGQRVLGVAYVDAASRKILISELVDGEYFQNLEALVVQLGPSECLLPSGDQNPDYAKVVQVLSRSSILVTRIKRSDFQTKDIVQDLNRLLKLDKGIDNCLHFPEVKKKLGMAALAALVRFLELVTEEAGLGNYKLGTFDSKQFVRLDAAAIEALQLNPSVQNSNKLQHLLGVINKCHTGPGQRLLSRWIKQPLMDLNKIEERQNMVGVFVADSVLRQTVHDDFLRKMPDFQKLARRFAKRNANLQDCYRMYQALQTLPQLEKFLKNASGEYCNLIHESFCNPLKDLLTDFSKFQQMVEEVIDLSLVDNGEFIVKAEFDDDLTELREKLNSLEASMKSELGKVAKELGCEAGKMIKLESNAQLGFFFRVTLKEEKLLRGNNNFMVIDAKKAGVRFHSSNLKDTNDEYLEAREEYEAKQKAIVNEIVGISASYVEPILQLSDVLAELDVVISFAVTATAAPVQYVKPKILPKESGIIQLVEARHPCMELQEYISYISNSASFDKEKRFLIITGPNMGGKSTYMRMVGVIVLLAQIGSFVPCESATISIVDAILTRVGSEDSHTRAVSTFMLEMIEMASILRTATENSLLIIDELGRGTSTYDGFGLAWAIAEKISKEIKAYCMFATHFHELTLLGDEVPSIVNFHVTAMITSTGPTFMYQVKPGVCDRSYGLHVAELVQFPAKVLEFAKQKARELEDFQSGSIADHMECSGDDEVSVRNRQTAKKDGEQIIMDFLRKVKQIDMDSLSEEEIKCAIDKLKSELIVKNNPYVQSILNRL